MALGNYDKKDLEKDILKQKTKVPISKIAAKVNQKTSIVEPKETEQPIQIKCEAYEAEIEDEKNAENIIGEPEKMEKRENRSDEKKEETVSENVLTKTMANDKDVKPARLSSMISLKAEEVTKKWMAEYGYKKLTPFVVDVLEGLDLYLTETDEQGKIPKKKVSKGIKQLGVDMQNNEREKPVKISIVLSEDANDRLNYWMPIYGEKKISAFIDYILRNLDCVLAKE